MSDVKKEAEQLLAETETLLREKITNPEVLSATLAILQRVKQLPAEALIALGVDSKNLAALITWLSTDITKARAAFIFKASQATLANRGWLLEKLLGIERPSRQRGQRLIKQSGGIVWPLPQELVEGWGLGPGWRVEWEIIDREKREIKLKLKPPIKL